MERLGTCVAQRQYKDTFGYRGLWQHPVGDLPWDFRST